MDIREIDLNLLVAFDALQQEGTVTAAAVRLRLSQPAMSNALRRLRELFGDALFVRVGNRMSPTPAGARIGESVRQALDLIQREVLQRAAFEPGSAQRVFNLCMTDVSEFTMVGDLVREVGRAAPQAELRLQSMPAADLQGAMASGSIDLAVGFFPEAPASLFQQTLYESRFVCIARRGNPVLRGGLTLESFRQAPQVAMKVRSQMGLVQRDLQAVGIERRVQVSVQHFHSLSEVLRRTDLIAIVPLDVARHLAGTFDAEINTLPYPSSRFGVNQYWHERYHGDPANQWLRGVVYTLFRKE